jgi:hypothetical protein
MNAFLCGSSPLVLVLIYNKNVMVRLENFSSRIMFSVHEEDGRNGGLYSQANLGNTASYFQKKQYSCSSQMKIQISHSQFPTCMGF